MDRINKQRVFNFYNRKNKWMGVIDYKSLAFCVLYLLIIFKVIFSFNISYVLKFYIATIFILPICIFVALNIQEESIIDKLQIIIMFFITRKKYINIKFFSKEKTIYVKNVEK